MPAGARRHPFTHRNGMHRAAVRPSPPASLRFDRAEHLLECLPQRDIDIRHAHGVAEIDQARDAVARVGHAAGNDGVEMAQIGLHIDGDAVERYPAPQPHADGGDLVLESLALVRPADPDADAILPPLAAHIEGRERPDDPFLEPRHIGAHVGPPQLQVEHDIGDPLAGAVIGDLAAAPGGKHRKARIEQVGRLAAGAGGVERGVFQQPDQFARPVVPDIGGAGFHGRDRLGVGDRCVRYPPFDRPGAGGACERR